MSARDEFLRLIVLAAEGSALRRLTLSKPRGDAPLKMTGRLALSRGQNLLAWEASYPDGKVKHSACPIPKLNEQLPALLAAFGQADLTTAAGNAELLVSKKGKETLIGGAALLARLQSDEGLASEPIAALDREKNYLLSGDEPFLRSLGISDATGRVHDKKQGKYRQINRFLEYVADIYPKLPKDGPLTVYDLCCGKSYLSFAVYYYLHDLRGREVDMLCMDLKEDVIAACANIGRTLGFSGMRFLAGDIRLLPETVTPHLVISLHACDIATDIVLETAVRRGAGVILSTPCCHRYLSHRLAAPEYDFVAMYPHLRRKLCEVLTDGLRAARLRAGGYGVTVSELTDPDDTPKNTLIIAVKRPEFRPHSPEAEELTREYARLVTHLTGKPSEEYLKEIRL